MPWRQRFPMIVRRRFLQNGWPNLSGGRQKSIRGRWRRFPGNRSLATYSRKSDSNVRTDFHPAARRELDDALNWYLDRSPRASERLAIAIDRAVENISDDPMRFPLID